MDMTTITAAMTSAKALKEFLQAAAGLKVDNEILGRINSALNEVASIQEKLFETREQLFNLQSENEKLKQQIKSHDEWTARRGEFSLNKTAGGAIVYESRSDSPKHYICPQCFEKQQVQILQDLDVYSGTFECSACKSHYLIKEKKKIEVSGPNRRRPDYF